MKIASFNINNINKRLPNLIRWLKQGKPNVACLQELKCETADFPEQALLKVGYSSVWEDQKSWNGVAILSKNGILTGDSAFTCKVKAAATTSSKPNAYLLHRH